MNQVVLLEVSFLIILNFYGVFYVVGAFSQCLKKKHEKGKSYIYTYLQYVQKG